MDYLQRVYDFIREKKMIEPGDRIVVGVSGGADSVCLLLMLNELKYRMDFEIFIVNVEHGIRGESSLEDSSFVKRLADNLNLPIEMYSFDVPKIAAEQKLSEEAAGRQVRYQAFEDAMKKHNCNKIAVAHNANDNTETVLINMLRGTGIQGLHGIKSSRDNIIRPLLCLMREEIEEYLAVRNMDFRTDETNLTDEYTRNKIRLSVLPKLLEINPQAIGHINELSQDVLELEEYLDKQAETFVRANVSFIANDDKAEAADSCRVSLDKLKKEPEFLRTYIIRKIIFNINGSLNEIARVHVNDILQLLDLGTGKSINLPKGLTVATSYNELIFKKEESNNRELIYNKELISNESNKKADEMLFEEIELTFDGETQRTQLSDGALIETRIIPNENIDLSNIKYTKYFDSDKISGRLFIRRRKNGDSLVIDTAGRRCKLKDYFINEKVDRDERDKIALLCDEKEILWVIGYRISELAKVSKDTKNVLEVKYMEEKG